MCTMEVAWIAWTGRIHAHSLCYLRSLRYATMALWWHVAGMYALLSQARHIAVPTYVHLIRAGFFSDEAFHRGEVEFGQRKDSVMARGLFDGRNLLTRTGRLRSW